MAAVRLTRAEQVERNRERLITAARDVFGEAGYAKATLDAISERAGFSKGVVYSQFASKADLFLVLLERRIDERAAQNTAIAETADPRDALAALVRAGDQDARDRQDWSRVLVEFRAHASYDPELNRRYAALHARTIEQLAGIFEQLTARAGVTPAVAPRSLAEFMLAVANGTRLERAASADALPTDDVITLVARALGLDGRTP
jgi:AcrR family transcriptional regulator